MSKDMDPFAQVVERLKREREEIDRTIALLEARISGNPAPAGSEAPPETHKEAEPTEENEGLPAAGQEGEFLGMKVADAARIVLNRHRRPMGPTAITTELERGGLPVASSRTIASVLHRRSKEVGDFVSPKRGLWGLKEWYPGRVFVRPGESSRGSAKQEAPAKPATETSEPEQPSEPMLIVPLRSNGGP